MPSKKRERYRANRKKKKLLEQAEDVPTKNKFGFSDLTPYNAITGQKIISRATLTAFNKKAQGSFNG